MFKLRLNKPYRRRTVFINESEKILNNSVMIHAYFFLRTISRIKNNNNKSVVIKIPSIMGSSSRKVCHNLPVYLKSYKEFLKNCRKQLKKFVKRNYSFWVLEKKLNKFFRSKYDCGKN